MKNKLTFEQRVGPEPKKNKPKHPPVTAAGAWNRAKKGADVQAQRDNVTLFRLGDAAKKALGHASAKEKIDRMPTMKKKEMKKKDKHPPVTAAGAWNRAKRATTTPEAAEHAQYRADYSAVRPKWDKTLAKGIADLKAKYRAKERAEKKKDKMK